MGRVTCASGMGVPRQGSAVYGGGGGREGMLFFNCFGQLSKSKLQQMEVKFKTEWGRCEKGNQNKTIELVLLKFSSGDQSCVSAPVTTGLESIFVCVCGCALTCVRVSDRALQVCTNYAA